VHVFTYIITKRNFFLIRSFRAIAQKSTKLVIEGPCNVVKKILELNRAKDIKTLVSSKNFNLDSLGGGEMLRLMKLEEPRRDIVIRSPRYGLTLKRDPKPKEKWIMAPYRFQTSPTLLKKQRNLVALSL